MKCIWALPLAEAQHFSTSNMMMALKIRDRIIFDFFSGLPHIYTHCSVISASCCCYSVQENTSSVAPIAWVAVPCAVELLYHVMQTFRSYHPVLSSGSFCVALLWGLVEWSSVILFLASLHAPFPPYFSTPSHPPPLHSPPPSHLFVLPLFTGALWHWHLPSVCSCSCAHCAVMSHWHVGMPPMPPCWALNSATIQKRYSHHL